MLKQQWPQLAKTLARTARHCSEAEQLLTEQAEQLLSTIEPDNNHLSIIELNKLSFIKQKLVLRHWLQQFMTKLPSEQQLIQLLNAVTEAKPDSQPTLQLSSHVFKRYRDRLYCLPATPLHSYLPKRWQKTDQPLIISNQHCITAIRASSGIPQLLWQTAIIDVRLRQGGEKIQLPYRQGSHSLKNLFQEAGVPIWERETIPLIYLNGCLAAIGCLWIDTKFFCPNGNCVQITIHYHSTD
ncbi:tRNA lysidine(34) synthetase TilS [Methylocucumis oryzae]|uniref:tRNA lysidine(34) synthetase TilS n=1 Tax=Methylocucumis oryzae TaxID=1632867 RepID=UPI000696242B|nr:tRNA lysidine(34) synthetase TilS [Methylocucumis oryzae]